MIIVSDKALWKSNFLNIRYASESATERDDKRLHVAFDCNTIPREDKNNLKQCVRCLKWLSETAYCNLFFYSTVKNLEDWRLWAESNYFKFSGFNINIEVAGPEFITKPFYDVLIDSKAGFDKKYWSAIDKVFFKGFQTLQHQAATETEKQGQDIEVQKDVPPTTFSEKEVDNYKINNNGTEIIYSGTGKYDIAPTDSMKCLAKKTKREESIRKELEASNPTILIPAMFREKKPN